MTAVRFIELDEDRRIASGLGQCAFYGPGAMWLCPWYHDPAAPEAAAERDKVLADYAAGKKHFLSVHYWRDHALSRPAIFVLCPDGSGWCPDQGSSNGTGWTTTGEPAKLTAHPSIVVSGYHGFLKDGVFTPDLEGRQALAWTPPALG